jgi:hypothetical protein
VDLLAYLNAVERETVHVERALGNTDEDFSDITEVAKRLSLRHRAAFLARF